MQEMNAVSNVVELSASKIEKLNDESQNSSLQEFKSVDNKDEFIESAEIQEIDPAKDPMQLKKYVTFEDETYKPTFQMQPEINSNKTNLKNDQQFVFGSVKNSQESVIKGISVKESLDLLKRSIESLKNREFSDFADSILQSVSKLSIEKSLQYKEIKNRISSAEMDEKLQNFELKDIEITLMDIGGLLEELLSNEHVGKSDDSEKRYVIVIQKLCDILSMLFGQFRDKIEAPEKVNEELNINIDATYLNAQTEEEPAIEVIDENEELDGKKICKCFSMKDELNKQSDEPVYVIGTEMKTAKSADFEVPEEENAVPIKHYNSLISTKISDNNLRKVQNIDDLSKTESSSKLKSQSFIRSKNIDEQMIYPLQSHVIQVSSIPSVITRYYTENLNETDSISSIKSETLANAIIEDLNDDGFQLSPKIPLSAASSSAWIDENISFVNSPVETQSVDVPKLETSQPHSWPVIPLESLCSVLCEPQLSNYLDLHPLSLTHDKPQPLTKVITDPQFTFDPLPSTSTADSEPVMKKPKRFAGCKKFVKRFMPSTLLRKKDRN